MKSQPLQWEELPKILAKHGADCSKCGYIFDKKDFEYQDIVNTEYGPEINNSYCERCYKEYQKKTKEEVEAAVAWLKNELTLYNKYDIYDATAEKIVFETINAAFGLSGQQSVVDKNVVQTSAQKATLSHSAQKSQTPEEKP